MPDLFAGTNFRARDARRGARRWGRFYTAAIGP